MKTIRVFVAIIFFLVIHLTQNSYAYYPPNEILKDIPDSFITKPKIVPKKIIKKTYNFNKVKIRGKVFNLEIVDTIEKRKKGLMFRKYLPQKNAMLFVFDKPGKYPFWMKNVSMSLDIIWISKKNKIIHMAHSLIPYSEEVVKPPVKAAYVLEINGGLAKKYHFKIGSRVEFMYNNKRSGLKNFKKLKNNKINDKEIKNGKSKSKDKNKSKIKNKERRQEEAV